jgi:transposase
LFDVHGDGPNEAEQLTPQCGHNLVLIFATRRKSLVAREHSSGNRIQRGGITKTGNGHLRRVLVEAAWAYQHRPNVIGFLLRRQKSLAISEEAKDIAWKAQQRLHKRSAARGKNKNQIVTAIGREMLGFIWAIAAQTEKQHKLAQVA